MPLVPMSKLELQLDFAPEYLFADSVVRRNFYSSIICTVGIQIY